MDACCAAFILIKDGKTRLNGYSEHVWIIEKVNTDRSSIDMLHFSADSLNMPIGELCQIVADLEGSFEYCEGWVDAHVPLKYVSNIAFKHE